MALGHVVAASLLAGGMLMAAVSAWHLLRRTPDFALYRTSLRIGLVTAALAIILVQGFGFAQFGPVGESNPPSSAAARPPTPRIAEWTSPVRPR